MTHRIALSKVIVITMLAFIYIFLLTQTFKQEGHVQKLEERLSDEQMKARLYDNQLSLQYQYDGIIQKDFSVMDEKGKGLFLSDILKQGNKIVIVFSSLNCSSCISNIFNNLDSLREDIDTKDILIIGQFKNEEGFSAFKQGNHVPWDLYFLKATEKDFLGDMLCQPYCCVMGKDLHVKDLFIPLKELPDLFAIYFEAIKEKYGFRANE